MTQRWQDKKREESGKPGMCSEEVNLTRNEAICFFPSCLAVAIPGPGGPLSVTHLLSQAGQSLPSTTSAYLFFLKGRWMFPQTHLCLETEDEQGGQSSPFSAVCAVLTC